MASRLHKLRRGSPDFLPAQGIAWETILAPALDWASVAPVVSALGPPSLWEVFPKNIGRAVGSLCMDWETPALNGAAAAWGMTVTWSDSHIGPELAIPSSWDFLPVEGCENMATCGLWVLADYHNRDDLANVCH